MSQAVTRDGIPVRRWGLPGNQHDSQCLDQVKPDSNSWNLKRVVWIMDRGMTIRSNQKILQKAGGQYILGEKLSETKLNDQALTHPGRFKVISDKLHIKEIYAGEGTARQRHVIVYNPNPTAWEWVFKTSNISILRIFSLSLWHYFFHFVLNYRFHRLTGMPLLSKC